MKTQSELRAFVWGVMAGLIIVIGSFMGVSQISDVKWRAVPGKEWRQTEADRHYGCTLKQQAPNGECQ